MKAFLCLVVAIVFFVSMCFIEMSEKIADKDKRLVMVLTLLACGFAYCMIELL